LRILVGCECSGVIRDAFNKLGHDAWSCDLQPSTGNHYQCNILDVLTYDWDLLIAHPPCTHLSVSGRHWTTRGYRLQRETDVAIAFFNTLYYAPIERICIENPINIIKEPHTQVIQPYEFGHDASKATCLWLKNLPKLKPTRYVKPRWIKGKPRWGNQTDSGQSVLGPSMHRAQIRSRTYDGVAGAMAEQWGIIQ